MDEVRGPPRKLPRIFIEEDLEDGLKEFFLVVYQVHILRLSETARMTFAANGKLQIVFWGQQLVVRI